MPTSFHNSLQALGSSLGYSGLIAGGYCNGFTLKWLEARFLGDKELHRFTDRVKRIRSKKNHLVKQINHVMAKKGALLTDSDMDLLEILAFYEGIELYQAPANFVHIFTKFLHQHSYAEISSLACSRGIEQLGGLKANHGSHDRFNVQPKIKCLDHHGHQ